MKPTIPLISATLRLCASLLFFAALKKHVTLPKHFAANGYRTLTTGKIYHDSGMPKDDFEAIGPIPGQRLKIDARIIPETPYGARGLWDFGPQTYADHLFQDHADASWAIEQLQQTSDKPFLLTVGFYRPHVPLYAPKRFFDEIPEDNIQLPVVRENDRDDIPAITKEITASRSLSLLRDSPKMRVHRALRNCFRSIPPSSISAVCQNETTSMEPVSFHC
jgi:hypothetical protein